MTAQEQRFLHLCMLETDSLRYESSFKKCLNPNATIPPSQRKEEESHTLIMLNP